MWSLHKRSIKLYSSQMCINCSRNAVYSLRLKSCLKRCWICLPFCWRTHFRRCRHSLILRSKNFWDTHARLPVSAVPQFQTVIAIHSLLQGFPHCVIYQVRVWTVCWSHRRLYKGDFLLCRYLTVFTVRRRAVLLQKHVVELISVVLS